jgi:hypothetical protein
MRHRITFELTFTPDGVTTIVHGVMQPTGQEIEFWVPTGTDEAMTEAARQVILDNMQWAFPGYELAVTSLTEKVV